MREFQLYVTVVLCLSDQLALGTWFMRVTVPLMSTTILISVHRSRSNTPFCNQHHRPTSKE